MIDYTAAGFTLLQGLCMRGRSREFAMSSSLTAKIIAVASNIPSDIVPRTARLSISAGDHSLPEVLLISTFI